MDELERDIFRLIAELFETYDASMGDANRSEVMDLKGKIQALELLARIEADKAADTPTWRERLRALEPLLVLLILVALIALVLLGVDINLAQLLP